MPSFFAVPSIICVSNWPARPTNGNALRVLIRSRAFADKHQRRLRVARAEDDLVAAFVQSGSACNRRCRRGSARACRRRRDARAESASRLRGAGASGGIAVARWLAGMRLSRRPFRRAEDRSSRQVLVKLQVLPQFVRVHVRARAAPGAAAAPDRGSGRRSRASMPAAAATASPVRSTSTTSLWSDSNPMSSWFTRLPTTMSQFLVSSFRRASCDQILRSRRQSRSAAGRPSSGPPRPEYPAWDRVRARCGPPSSSPSASERWRDGSRRPRRI